MTDIQIKIRLIEICTTQNPITINLTLAKELYEWVTENNNTVVIKESDLQNILNRATRK